MCAYILSYKNENEVIKSESESSQKKPKDSSYREKLRARRKAFWVFCLFVFEKGILNLDEVKDFSAMIYIANKQTNT